MRGVASAPLKARVTGFLSPLIRLVGPATSDPSSLPTRRSFNHVVPGSALDLRLWLCQWCTLLLQNMVARSDLGTPVTGAVLLLLVAACLAVAVVVSIVEPLQAVLASAVVVSIVEPLQAVLLLLSSSVL